MKAKIAVLILGATMMAGAADTKAPAAKMTVRMADGSTLVAEPKFETLKVKFAFAESKIPVGLVSSLVFASNSVKVTFANGDVLTGAPEFDDLEAKTSFGDVALKIANIRNVSFAASATGDWLTFRTPDVQNLDEARNDHVCNVSSFLQDHELAGLFDELPTTVIGPGQQYRFQYKGSRGYPLGEQFSLWAKFNKATGRLVTIWGMNGHGGLNAMTMRMVKDGDVWRGTGMSTKGHPAAFAIKDDGSVITMKWGSAVDGNGSDYILVRWNVGDNQGLND